MSVNHTHSPLSKTWRYDDETERMAEERHPPSADAILRAGTREQLMERYALGWMISPMPDEGCPLPATRPGRAGVYPDTASCCSSRALSAA